jgi:hypothetical protein
MKQALVVLTACLLCAGVATAWEQYGDVPVGTEVTPWDGDPFPPSPGDRDLTFWTDPVAFEATFTCLTYEDFSGTIVGPNSIEACEGPFNSETNNACFWPGGIVEGISVHNLGLPGEDLNVVITPTALGNSNVMVGPNTFVSDGTIIFDPPVEAFSMEFYCPLEGGPIANTIEVYGASGLLGTDPAAMCNPAPVGLFWGVSSSGEPITHIVVYGGGSGGELFSMCSFGVSGASPAEPSTWGQIKISYK